jgi:hypothetical protein
VGFITFLFIFLKDLMQDAELCTIYCPSVSVALSATFMI